MNITMNAVARRITLYGLTLLMLSACGSDGNDNSSPPPAYTVGATVSGLSGSGLVLQNNSNNSLRISANGSFTLVTALDGAAYAVTVKTQPAGQVCTVTNGAGTVAAANVSVSVVCETVYSTFTVGGTVSGLSGSGLVLQNNSGDDLSISADGSFTFVTELVDATAYAVSVQTQPPGQTCSVTNGAGTVAGANVTSVSVVCASNTATFTIGGTVYGLSGSGLVLQNNSGDDLSVAADGSFTFATELANAAAYAVSVGTQPSGLTCTVSNGAGTVAGANVSDVQIRCQHFTYIANSDDDTISAFVINSVSGALSGIGSPVSTGDSPAALAIGGGGKFLYCANSGDGTDPAYGNVSGFSVDAVSGALTPLTGSPFAGVVGVNVLATDPAGKYLYLASSFGGASITAYSIDGTTGALTAVPGSPFSAGISDPTSIVLDVAGKFAYVTNSGTGSVSTFSVDPATGALSPLGSPVAAGTRPFSIALVEGRFAYVVNAGDGNVSAYAVNPTTGVLTALSGSPFTTFFPSSDSPFLGGITVDASGNHVYVADAGDVLGVRAFTIGTDGTYTPIAGSPFAAGAFTSTVTIDPSGKFALAPDADSNNVLVYAIDSATGALAPASGSPVATGARPAAIVID